MSIFFNKALKAQAADGYSAGVWTLRASSVGGLNLGTYRGDLLAGGLDGGGWKVEGLYPHLGWRDLSGVLDEADSFRLDHFGVLELKVTVLSPGAAAEPLLEIHLMTRSI